MEHFIPYSDLTLKRKRHTRKVADKILKETKKICELLEDLTEYYSIIPLKWKEYGITTNLSRHHILHKADLV